MDFSYISGQTFGDHRLETELLELFLAQARSLIPHLPERRAQDEAAHLLKGSALAAGATRIAAAAGAYGDAAAHARHADGPLYKELVAAFQEAEAAIETRLALLRDKNGDVPR
ncbi:MAG: Hpt domain-containing protein [Beijerinckiaceae bacterium]|jgi:HPt (histidine-containing phosphotransfer) domain-containing protein